MDGMGRFQLSDLFIELPVPPHAAGVIGKFSVLFYIILSTTISILDLNDIILFLQYFLYTSIFLLNYTLHVCYVFNVI